MDIIQITILILSVLSPTFVWGLLRQPDPAFAWQTEFGYVDTTLMDDDELYVISPTHDTRGLV